MSDTLGDSFNCSRCGHFVFDDPVTDTDTTRSYNGRDVCVSCLITLKRENDDYSA